MLKLDKSFRICLFVLTSLALQVPSIAQTKSDAVTPQLLKQIIQHNRNYTQEGAVADYIPQLAKADPSDIAIAVVTDDGKVVKAGDVKQTFTIQSISKIIGLMLAVEDRGETEVYSRLGYYGTNKPFNYFANLDNDGKPLNPLMNAGAILTTSMIKGEGKKPYKRILARIRYITKNKDIQLNKTVYHSEKSTGNRNRGVFYILKANGLLKGTEEELDNYFRQCSIEVSVVDLAKIAYFFAHDCVRFDGDDRYENADMAELIQSQMMIAGMYDYSGKYAREVGLPSKSGVGGGIVATVPGDMGIGVYSPALDEHGNSVAGYHMILELAEQLELSLFQ